MACAPSGRTQRRAQELEERRAVAVGGVEAQPLCATPRGGEQGAAREQDRMRPGAPHELLHRRPLRHPPPQEDALAGALPKLDAGGFERRARITPHTSEPRTRSLDVLLVAAAAEHLADEALEQRRTREHR